MARRFGGPLHVSARYCANKNTKEVHDLDNENINCQIDEIIIAGHAISIFTLAYAHVIGYDNCKWCIGNSKR